MPNECPKGGRHSYRTDGQHQNEFCEKCHADRPTPSPLEGIEIPEYDRISDGALAAQFKRMGSDGVLYSSDEIACELVERRLADHDSIRIPKDVAERMAKEFISEAEAGVEDADGTPLAPVFRWYAAILRGETDAK